MDIKELYSYFLTSNGVSIDTRTISSGQLFFALKGRTFDGNQMAQQAIDAGALYVVVDDASVVQNDQYLLVGDVLVALQELARYHRSKIKVPVLGITGSNGKTTTKELMREVLSTRYNVACTVGNFNNHIGLPLTLLNEARDAEIWILEMGSNAPGNIQELCDIGMPSLGLITNVGFAHLEQLKSQEGVFAEKKSLFDSVIDRDGIIFINSDDMYLIQYAENGNSILYSSTQVGDFQIAINSKIDDGLSLEIQSKKEVYEIDSQLTGTYNIENISAAFAVGLYFEIPPSDICNAINSYLPSNMRSQTKQSERNELVIDAYNANPSSMQESILSHLSKSSKNLVFILGDMLELGDRSIAFHELILNLLDFDSVKVITVGSIFESAENRPNLCFSNVEELLGSNLLSGLANQHILIKGSRGIKLEKVIPYL